MGGWGTYGGKKTGAVLDRTAATEERNYEDDRADDDGENGDQVQVSISFRNGFSYVGKVDLI
jgi:hypothetical protein